MEQLEPIVRTKATSRTGIDNNINQHNFSQNTFANLKTIYGQRVFAP